jgi:Ca2+-binding RTX toxin-like protein
MKHFSAQRMVVFLAALLLGSAGALGADLVLPVAGRVSMELISSDASFSNTLALVSPAAAIVSSGCQIEGTAFSGLKLMSEKQSQHGCRVELDADPVTPGIQGFAAGAVLRFNLCAQTDADPTTCENLWSSDAASNGDGIDHVRTTTTASGVAFQLAWEDLPGGGDNDFNDLIAVVRTQVDADGDGLWDDWETAGIDTNGDGTIDLDLAGLGANPMHKDVFVEIDFMDCAAAGGDCAAGDTHSHQPRAAAINAVVQVFGAIPNAVANNPDGLPGINLHVGVGNAIRHQDRLFIPGAGCAQGTAADGNFDTVKADPANFGPDNPRRFAYHYALFVHRDASTNGSSGCGELPGNDFIVSLGTWNAGMGDLDGDGLVDADVGTIQQQAGTLIHELGHNLNLQHGGGDGVNFKPNYLSAMNYRFQFGIPPTDPDGAGAPLTGRIDYSRSALGNLVEPSLNEPAGIGDGTDSTMYFCPDGTTRTMAGTGAIDWNCDNSAAGTGVSADINADGVRAPAAAPLAGFNDWANLEFDFQTAGDYADGEHRSSLPTAEMDYPTYLQIAAPAGPTCFGVRATIVGSEGNDVLNGTPGDDVIVALGGADRINGGGGNDLICGGDGDDKIDGGSGNDLIDAGSGNDIVLGGAGDDTLKGGPGNDRLEGGSGNDLVEGGDGNDVLEGGAGQDNLDGGAGNDVANGGAGADICRGAETTVSCP